MMLDLIPGARFNVVRVCSNTNHDNGDSVDEQIAQQFIRNKEADLIINVLAVAHSKGVHLACRSD